MVDPIVLENFWNSQLVMEVAVGWMEDGVTGHLGQFVEVIVRNQDIEDVTIQHLQMEDWIVKEPTKRTASAMEEDV